MNILIVATGYPSEKYIMNGIFQFDQARALMKAGHKVSYAAVDLRSIRRSRNWGIENFIKDGIEVWAINIPCGNIPKKLLYKIGEVGLSYLYKKIQKKEGNPDIIHSHFNAFGYISLMALKGYHIPIVITEHSSAVNANKLSPFEIKCHDFCLLNADAYLCVGNILRDNIKKLSKSTMEIYVVPNMVSSIFKFIEKKSEEKDFIFFSLGNLIERKRFGMTIQAFSKAFKENHNVKLYIGGYGELYSVLKRQINELNMNEQIVLLGQLSRIEVVEYMQKCNTFVLASVSETFGVVYIEALACGKPVIGTRNGGADDIINDTNGLLVNVDNTEQLAAAMNEMYSNYYRYDQMDISNKCLSKYSDKALADRLIKIYEAVINIY